MRRSTAWDKNKKSGEAARLLVRGDDGQANTRVGSDSSQHPATGEAGARQSGDRGSAGAWLGNLGLAYAALGEARRVIEFYEQALEVAREGGDQRGEGNHLYNMSLAYHQLGEYTKAVSLAETAVKIYEMIEDPHVEKVRQKLAEWQTVLSE